MVGRGTEDELPGGDFYDAHIGRYWAEPHGDRRQEIVFIGIGIDQDALRRRLDAALVDDAEMHAGLEAWAGLADPFPSWDPEKAAV